MSSATAALRPENKAPRAVLADRRGTANYFNNNVATVSTTTLRLQRLRLLGIIGIRAELIASLVWEARHG